MPKQRQTSDPDESDGYARDLALIGAEKIVLGSLMIYPDKVGQFVTDKLRMGDFLDTKIHGTIYAHLSMAWVAGEPLEKYAIGKRLTDSGELEQVGGWLYLNDLINHEMPPVNINHYVGIILEAVAERENTAFGIRLQQAADDPDRFAEILAELNSRVERRKAESGNGVSLLPIDDIEIEPTRWLWDTTPDDAPPTSQGRVPMNTLCIAFGGPGIGKSQFAVWMAARITTGTLPGELWGKPRNVVYAATEDSWKFTIKPRLIVAGADISRIRRVEVKESKLGRKTRLTLPAHTEDFGIKAEQEGVALLILDPLLSHITDSINSNNNQELRTALEPLVDAADRHGFGILGLAHFRKNRGKGAMVDEISGGGAFGQLTRSALAFARNENDPDGNERFVMSQAKNNLGILNVPSYEYTIQPVTLDTPKGPSRISRFVLGGQTLENVAQVMDDMESPDEQRTERKEATEWLREWLSDPARNGEDTKDSIDKANGGAFSAYAMGKASARLGVVKAKLLGSQTSGWLWFLPDAYGRAKAAGRVR